MLKVQNPPSPLHKTMETLSLYLKAPMDVKSVPIKAQSCNRRHKQQEAQVIGAMGCQKHRAAYRLV